MNPDNRMAFSVKEVCEMLGVSHMTVYAWIKDGSLLSVKIGNRRLVLRGALEKLLHGQKHGQAHGSGKKAN